MPLPFLNSYVALVSRAGDCALQMGRIDSAMFPGFSTAGMSQLVSVAGLGGQQPVMINQQPIMASQQPVISGQQLPMHHIAARDPAAEGLEGLATASKIRKVGLETDGSWQALQEQAPLGDRMLWIPTAEAPEAPASAGGGGGGSRKVKRAEELVVPYGGDIQTIITNYERGTMSLYVPLICQTVDQLWVYTWLLLAHSVPAAYLLGSRIPSFGIRPAGRALLGAGAAAA